MLAYVFHHNSPSGPADPLLSNTSHVPDFGGHFDAVQTGLRKVGNTVLIGLLGHQPIWYVVFSQY